jgi:hypothetical protein
MKLMAAAAAACSVPRCTAPRASQIEGSPWSCDMQVQALASNMCRMCAAVTSVRCILQIGKGGSHLWRQKHPTDEPSSRQLTMSSWGLVTIALKLHIYDVLFLMEPEKGWPRGEIRGVTTKAVQRIKERADPDHETPCRVHRQRWSRATLRMTRGGNAPSRGFQKSPP